MAGGRMSASDGTPRELLLYRHPNKVLRAAIRRGPEPPLKSALSGSQAMSPAAAATG